MDSSNYDSALYFSGLKSRKPLEEVLNSLRLAKSCNMDSLYNLMTFAATEGWSATDVVTATLNLLDEKRLVNKCMMNTKLARFPWQLATKSFDHELGRANPMLTKELSNCSWINAHQNLLFTGGSGLGKTHFAVYLGKQAISKGYITRFFSAIELFNEMEKDQIGMVKKLNKVQVLILDDLGHEGQDGHHYASSLYQLLAARYDKALNTIITTNRNVTDWGPALGSPETVKAALDRFLENAVQIEFQGSSHRLETFAKRKLELQKKFRTENEQEG